MGRKNDFLTKMQEKHKQEAKTAVVLTEKWTRQAACDALVLLFGYGESMGKKPWGQEKIYRAVMEWTELFLWIMRGLEGYQDSDAIRVQVDRLLKPKVPEELYREWDGRYPGMLGETMEEEVQRMRPKWLRDGDLTEDPVTSKLLKGVGRDG
jgi:hypothetical protein